MGGKDSERISKRAFGFSSPFFPSFFLFPFIRMGKREKRLASNSQHSPATALNGHKKGTFSARQNRGKVFIL